MEGGKMEKLEMQKNLQEELVKASDAYYNGGMALMSDHEFDVKVAELKAMEAETGVVLPGSPTTDVGAAVKVGELLKARHEHPALSLDKVKYKDRDDLKKWLGDKEGVLSWKLDGLTVVVTYDDGVLTKAVTRGNGEEGSDITHNARFFKGLPQQISWKKHLVVRGEAMMTIAEFERINEEEGGIYQNARNLAGATIQMLDANESRKREIIFKAFKLVVPDSNMLIGEDHGGNLDIYYELTQEAERFDWLKSMGFGVVDYYVVTATPKIPVDEARYNLFEAIEDAKEKVSGLGYPTDGLVLSYNDQRYADSLGNTGHHPRGSIAMKWTDEVEETVVHSIDWSVGKTGIITPVAVFDTVRLGLGSNVSRASLHNLTVMSHIPSLDGSGTCKCGIGSKATVYLANMIIPQIEQCSEGELAIADKCPVCGAKTEIRENNGIEVLYCPNTEGCPAQQIGRLANSFGKSGFDVKGLGDSQITDLINAGLLSDTLSLYQLKETAQEIKEETGKDVIKELLAKDGWGDKKWQNLLDAVEASKKTTLRRFLYALNIPLLGNDLSKKLAKHFGNIEEFVKFIEKEDKEEPVMTSFLDFFSAGGEDDNDDVKMDELTSIEGVGEEKARNIVDWANDIYKPDSEKWGRFLMLCNTFNFSENMTPSVETMNGLTFVITGSVNVFKNRDEFKAFCEERGAKVSGSVSKATTALVCNEASSSTKSKKAQELGIEVITEDEFLARYGSK